MSTSKPKKKLLIVQSKPPFGSSSIQESLDIVLAAGTFDQNVSLLLEEDACYQLLSDQQPECIDKKNTTKMLKALPIYGVENIYVCSQSAEARHISTQGNESLMTVNAEEIKRMYKDSDTVIRF